MSIRANILRPFITALLVSVNPVSVKGNKRTFRKRREWRHFGADVLGMGRQLGIRVMCREQAAVALSMLDFNWAMP